MKKRVNRNIHPHWAELIDYIENMGGYVRLEIKFQQGIPIIAENVREQVKFGINKNYPKDKK